MPVATFDQQLLDVLRADGVITADQAQRVVVDAEKNGAAPEDILRRERFATEEAVAQAKGKILNIPFFDLVGKTVPPTVLALIPRQTAETFQLIPFAVEGATLNLGLVNPTDYRAVEAADFLSQQKSLTARYFIITPGGLKAAMRAYEAVGKEVAQVIELAKGTLGGEEEAKPRDEEGGIEEVIKGAPVSRIVSVILKSAVGQNASDVHIEPYGNIARVRFRVDGVLRTALTLPLFLLPAVVARVKVLASLKLDETRIPQDGRIRQEVSGRPIDFRISTLPVVDHEKVVMRILSADAQAPTLENLGFRTEHVELMKSQVKRPHGLFLMTGPTGSGKSTTLYAVLTLRNEEGINIVTLEDPIEYYIKGINQSQIRPEINYSFATGLRAILRQDPNVVMVGEIRDRETGELVVHAALTGHLIFSTIHTNDSFGVVPRLLDMGVEPFLIAATLNIAVAQRLARKACPHCRAVIEVAPEVRDLILTELARIPKKYVGGRDLKTVTLYRGAGCGRCNNTGYIGRISIAEILMVTDELRKIIESGFPIDEAKKEATRQEMLNLKQDGILKALDGLTTIEEVMRITRE
jgi:type IV pilus assembly protein PilB